MIPWDVSRGITKHTQNDVFYLSSAAAARNIRRRRNASTRRFPLFFLLAMRVQLCYNRWWEARSLWGLTISRSRNLARLAMLYRGRVEAVGPGLLWPSRGLPWPSGDGVRWSSACSGLREDAGSRLLEIGWPAGTLRGKTARVSAR